MFMATLTWVIVRATWGLWMLSLFFLSFPVSSSYFSHFFQRSTWCVPCSLTFSFSHQKQTLFLFSIDSDTSKTYHFKYDTNNRNHNNNDTIEGQHLHSILVYTSSLVSSPFSHTLSHSFSFILRLPNSLLDLGLGPFPSFLFWPNLVTGPSTGQFRDGHKSESMEERTRKRERERETLLHSSPIRQP